MLVPCEGSGRRMGGGGMWRCPVCDVATDTESDGAWRVLIDHSREVAEHPGQGDLFGGEQ